MRSTEQFVGIKVGGAFDHDIIYIDIHVRDIFIKEMICKENNYGK